MEGKAIGRVNKQDFILLLFSVPMRLDLARKEGIL